ncbi:MAG: transcriptional regulator [Proteobacteria bacterium]|nr:transcriptional regulator [Pseudomonadota bacterium]
MNFYQLRLVTIVTEAALESSLIQDIEQLGAHGYTITDARGKGDRGLRNAGGETSANIRIEIVCNAQVSEAIAAHLKQHYYHNYAMILYISDVDVLRPDKF